MKFMALESWYHNGQLHEASAQQPHVFEFPKDEIPSRRWWPLDKEARAALEKYQKEKADKGIKIDIRPIPDLALPVSAEVIEPSEKVDPDALPPDLFAAKKMTAVPTPSMSEVQREPARPSDTEPTKRK